MLRIGRYPLQFHGPLLRALVRRPLLILFSPFLAARAATSASSCLPRARASRLSN